MMKQFALLAVEFKFAYFQGLVLVVCLVIAILLLVEFRGMKDMIRERLGMNNDAMRLQLEAIERLTLYAERAGLQSLVGRIYTGNNVAKLQQEMVEAIKSEYDYNITQQVYVLPEIWNAITRLKDQNIYVINQLAATLPQDSPGIELSKRIIEFSTTKNAELNKFVIEALQHEAKKLLKQ
ncbi:MAG: hypothetical protein IT254_09260 [Chitinophagaceae bacterium]|nr:hypothetical protein [Bacteroidota bacterium]MCC6258498.1 hypothetical protein [Chitinophagaceae bacterium]MCW5918023.1 hypothetical protein [Ferruginibacter sp.]